MKRLRAYIVVILLEIKNQKNLTILLLIQLTFWFRLSVISPVLTLYMLKLGISVTQIGFLMMVRSVGWAIFEPTFGFLADIMNKKKLIIYSVISSSIIFISYTYASKIWHFLLIVFAMSSALAIGAVSSRALLNELLPLQNRGRVYGRYMAIVSIGRIIGPILGGYIAENIGFKAPFYLSGGVGILALFFLTFLNYEKKNIETFHSVKTQIKMSLSVFGMRAAVFSILLIRLLFMFNMHFQRTILPVLLYESQNFRASETKIGLYFGVIMLSASLSQLFLGNISDKIGSNKLMVFGLMMGGISYLSLNILKNLTALYIVGFFQGIFFAASELSMMITYMGVIPSDSSGIAMGIYGLSEDMGGILSSPTLGMIYDLKGSVFIVNFISAVLIMIALISRFLLKKDDIIKK